MSISFLPDYLHEKNKQIIDRYGLDNQLLQLQEECAELIQKISKYRRAKETYGKAEVEQALTDIEMEIADVVVVTDQVADRTGMSKELLYTMAEYKIDRQLKRMKK